MFQQTRPAALPALPPPMYQQNLSTAMSPAQDQQRLPEPLPTFLPPSSQGADSLNDQESSDEFLRRITQNSFSPLLDSGANICTTNCRTLLQNIEPCNVQIKGVASQQLLATEQ
eukprot:95046-Hanusia_phi.AAC.1